MTSTSVHAASLLSLPPTTYILFRHCHQPSSALWCAYFVYSPCWLPPVLYRDPFYAHVGLGSVSPFPYPSSWLNPSLFLDSTGNQVIKLIQNPSVDNVSYAAFMQTHYNQSIGDISQYYNRVVYQIDGMDVIPFLKVHIYPPLHWFLMADLSSRLNWPSWDFSKI